MNHSETNIVTINPKIGMSPGENRRLLHTTLLLHEFRNSCMRIQMSIDHAHYGMGMELLSLLAPPLYREMRRPRSSQTFLWYRPSRSCSRKRTSIGMSVSSGRRRSSNHSLLFSLQSK